ncbi:dTDP-4-dehydrorhamnose reductase [Croceibacter atlanticus]|uniref:dTDP-4-dehydrorhamnose reductase n=1 Tax=Croceibacter atlanticus (strain ATCC BAA-628 / JCM 21780 / CIP 108009 / IAM 15332 / KCTC 12090 / HTCC2559) TaxID=216432 RepID=A3UAZ4_CROAH|nr:dTDP-4-dehydrorhamnose reductase [Croceibacter atlanticus]EAP86980.1 putative dTDP-4-dehydrorhamnose reductase [Croceibacter atlanticus HTCC2559]
MKSSKANTILVTGANGQLGTCIKAIANNYPSCNVVFEDSSSLDITNRNQVVQYMSNSQFDYIINCAAYTAVDLAEDNKEKAFEINAKAVENLTIACKRFSSTLLHVSTDFVFDGKKNAPYLERDSTHPLNYYGASKLNGEQIIQQALSKYVIIRTSWLFSEFGNNFVKTMVRLGQEKKELSIVADQYGSPTYAIDLAHILLTFIASSSTSYGLYHFSNHGATTWYNFAAEIFKLQNQDIRLHKTTSKQFASRAIRPKYSVLETKKVKETLNVEIRNWQSALKEMISRL